MNRTHVLAPEVAALVAAAWRQGLQPVYDTGFGGFYVFAQHAGRRRVHWVVHQRTGLVFSDADAGSLAVLLTVLSDCLDTANDLRFQFTSWELAYTPVAFRILSRSGR